MCLLVCNFKCVYVMRECLQCVCDCLTKHCLIIACFTIRTALIFGCGFNSSIVSEHRLPRSHRSKIQTWAGFMRPIKKFLFTAEKNFSFVLRVKFVKSALSVLNNKASC